MACIKDDIFIDTRLMFYTAKVYGFISSNVKSTKDGRKQLVHVKWHYYISSAMQAIILLCGYVWCVQACKNHEATVDGLFFILNVLSEISNYAACFVFCVHTKLFIAKHRRSWQELCDIERDLTKAGISLNHRFLRILTYVWVFCTLSFSFATIIFSYPYISFDRINDRKSSLYKFGMCLYFHYSCVIGFTLYAQCILGFQIAREMFDKFEEYLKSLFLSNSKTKTTKSDLLDVAKYHQRLCNIARSKNSIISVPLLLLFGQQFC